ncbi:MAG: zinc-binding dehydrogenase [Candidatus Marinimicrobia bacterium]|nr:zinc-binding dehydrogenase [Candidatus Neomarinimicrobiota bacterium]
MSQNQIPDQMTAIVLDSYSGVAALRVEQRSVPKPGRNEVLIKIAASPINPSDLSFIEGLYNMKKPAPVIPGLEGSGTVVLSGGGLMANYLHGKAVACTASARDNGVWAEYMVCSIDSALPLNKTLSLEQGAMSIVNPLTAIALISIAKKNGHKTIIHTAAASTLGLMLNRLARKEGIEVINIVRRLEQLDLLKEHGAGLILNSSEVHFSDNLREICHKKNARLAFDAVAGAMTGQLLEAMPAHSKVTVYGGLSGEAVLAHPGQIITQNKKIDGFWLSPWLARQSMLKKIRIWRKAQKMVSSELKSEVRARYPLEEIKRAVMDYQNQMTGGKVLIVPN